MRSSRLADAVIAARRMRSSRLADAVIAARRMRSSRLAEDVTDAAKSVEKALLAGVDLAPQIRHVGLDDVDIATEVVAPHVVEDLRLAQHGARVDHEVAQQG